jgi:UPF0755 protein
MKFFFGLVLLLILAGGGVFYFYLRTPYGPTSETFVDIPTGTGSAGIATRLEQAGVIRSRYVFLGMRRVYGGTLHAGVYRFDHPVKPFEAYARIVKGDVFTITLVVPEGFNLFDIAAAVQSAHLGSSAGFLAAARANTALIADVSPHATSLEGFLFPDTYRFSPHATPAQMLAAMVKRFRQVATQLHLLSPDGVPTQDLNRTVTMASLIEKEVRLDSERPVVAGVFVNRLALNMPLATDPSVIYTALLAGRWRGAIYQSDLASDSPYNTYRHTGLPPGPIANPGAAALKAAINPAQTDYLYFVADANGATRFSVDLKEHTAQVLDYRRAQTPRP